MKKTREQNCRTHRKRILQKEKISRTKRKEKT